MTGQDNGGTEKGLVTGEERIVFMYINTLFVKPEILLTSVIISDLLLFSYVGCAIKPLRGCY